jgi:hypothetical protein
MVDTLLLDEDAQSEIAESAGAAAPAIIPNPYPLKYPISIRWKGPQGERLEEVTEIKLRRATGEELLLIDRFRQDPMRLVLEMIAALSGHPLKVIQRLDGEDIGPLGELAFSNAPSGPATGAIS